MSILVSINRDYLDKGVMYRKDSIELNPGITILVGCNGAGKTTFNRQLKHFLNENKIPFKYFDNLTDGGNNASSSALLFGDFDFIAKMALSSEGEGIINVVSEQIKNLGKYISENNSKSYVYIFDAMDSGLSIDNIIDVKTAFRSICNLAKKKFGTDIYFIISTNSFEFAHNENCLDVVAGEYIHFLNYEEYRNFIISSRHIKDIRNKRWIKNSLARQAKKEKLKKEQEEKEKLQNNEPSHNNKFRVKFDLTRRD